MTPAEAVQKLLAVLDGKEAPQGPGFTLEDYARGSNGKLHVRQLRAMSSSARYILEMCSRRAGKTAGKAGRYAYRAKTKPGSNRTYIALTKDQARAIFWEPFWKPVCERYQLCKPTDHNETRMVTHFSNGSTVRATGSDDIRHIATELGSSQDEVSIDECQDQPPHVLKTLVDKILPPALGDRLGTLNMSGVIPDAPVGFFWDTWKTGTWENHQYSMFDNPHFPDPQRVVDDYLAKHPGLTIDSPLIQRDYYGREVFDALATAYQYSRSLNGYQAISPGWLLSVYATQRFGEHELAYAHPMREHADDGALYGVMSAVPHDGIDIFSFAIDPGATTDRCAIEGWGFGTRTREVQHIFDWATPRGVNLPQSKLFAMAGLANAEFSRLGAVLPWAYDMTAKNPMDNLKRDYGLPLILAAKKGEMYEQVKRNAELLTSGRGKVMEGSALEQDYQRAQWDKNALANGQRRWSANWHPDPSESGRYALAPVFDAYTPPDVRTVEEHMRDEEKERIERLLERSRTGYDVQDQLGNVLGFDE